MALQWFDVLSIATLLDVTPHAVRGWIRQGKLPAVKRGPSAYLTATGAQNGQSMRQAARKKWYVARHDLEKFLVTQWESASHLPAPGAPGEGSAERVTVESLLRAGSESGEIEVTFGGDLDPTADFAGLSAAARSELVGNLQHVRARPIRSSAPDIPITHRVIYQVRNHFTASPIKPRPESDERPHPVQLELPLAWPDAS